MHKHSGRGNFPVAITYFVYVFPSGLFLVRVIVIYFKQAK